MTIQKNWGSNSVGAIVAFTAILLPTASLAAGTATGVEAGFFALGTDLNTILTGAGGFAILIISVLIGGAVYAFTGRMQYVAAAAGLALFLGYGVQVLTSLSGVTATTDMIEDLALVASSEDRAAIAGL